MSKWLTREGFRRLTSFLGPAQLRLLAAGIGVGALLFAVELAFAYALQAFLAALGLFDRPAQLPFFTAASGGGVVAFILVMAALRSALNGAQVYMFGATYEVFRQTTWRRLLELTFTSESVASGQLMSMFSERCTNAATLLRSVQSALLHSLTAALLGAALLFLAPGITLLALGLLAVVAIPLQRLDRRLKDAAQGLAAEYEDSNRRLLVGVRNLLLLQIHGTTGSESRAIQESLARYYRHTLRYYLFSGLKFGLPQLVGIAVVCLIGVSMRQSHAMEPAALVSYLYLFIRLVQSLTEVARASPTLAMYGPQLAELEAFCRAPTPRRALPVPSGDAPALPPGPIGWSLEAVTFRHPAQARPLLDALHLHVRPGSSLVITGPSGAGKSTLLHLMLGGLQPSSGQVRVLPGEGAPVPLELARPALLPRIGYVGPESFLIEGTLRDNLLYGLHTRPEEPAIRRALALSECGFVDALPEGLDHRLTEQGHGLSAGQKQRLALARALLRSPSALVLDEATANLDLETEARMVQTLTQLKGELTLVAVTHRQALLALADEVVKLS